MRNIKHFKNQVREAFLKDVETLDLSKYQAFDHLQDAVSQMLWDIGDNLLPEYFPEGELSNEAALSCFIAMPELLDAEWIEGTPRENIAPSLRSMTADQLGEELEPGLRQKFEAANAAAPKL